MKINKITYSIAVLAATFLTVSSLALAIDNDTEDKNVPEIKAEDIQPAVPQVINATDNTIKNANDGEIKNTSDIKDESLVKNVEANENQEVKKDLPVLEDIQLHKLGTTAADYKPVKIEVSSQRIPAGTTIPVQLDSMISSQTSNIGDQFNATLSADIIVGDNIILPAGSVLRGTVGNVKKSGLCFIEAKIMLIFDHIVTPAGKQIPIYTYLKNDDNVNYEGYIVGGTSYAKAFKKDANISRDIIVNSTTYGVDKGLAYLKGVPVVLTAPVCAIGGTLGGGGYIIGKSVYNIFNKGGDVMLNQGTKLNITLSKNLDVPAN